MRKRKCSTGCSIRLIIFSDIFLQPRPQAKRCAGDEVDLFIIFIDFPAIKSLLTSILLSC